MLKTKNPTTKSSKVNFFTFLVFLLKVWTFLLALTPSKPFKNPNQLPPTT